MADAERRDDNYLKIFSSQIGDNIGKDCEKCIILGNRLTKIQKELKTAKLIIELLLEDVESLGEADPGVLLDNISELQISPKDKNWNQVQDDPYRKKTLKLKDQSEIYVETKNSSVVRPNL